MTPDRRGGIVRITLSVDVVPAIDIPMYSARMLRRMYLLATTTFDDCYDDPITVLR
jgi:hypothetical protein